MKDLQAIVAETGVQGVSTFIASGNVVFETGKRSPATLERMLEQHLAARLGYAVPTFIRSEEEVVEILAVRPFSKMEEGNTVVVILCKDVVPEEAAGVLGSVRSATDTFFVRRREIFWWTVAGISTSSVWKLPEIKALALPASTLRNINTLERLAGKFDF